MRVPPRAHILPDSDSPFVKQLAKVEAVLREFAAAAPADGIPYASTISSLARLIMHEARGAPPTVSRRATRTKLHTLREAAESLLANFRSDLSLAMEFPLEDRLVIARCADLDPDLRGRRGQPPKQAAARIARLLTERVFTDQQTKTKRSHFEMLTGLRPARNTRLREGTAQKADGRFIDLLTRLYGVLDISASVDNQAKKAIKALENNRHEI